MTGPRKKNYFLSHKNYSNATRILCISVYSLYLLVAPIIFLYFRQVHGHLLTAFAIHTDTPEIHKCRSFFAKAKPLFRVNFIIFNWQLKAFTNFFCLNKIIGYPSFAPWKMF